MKKQVVQLMFGLGMSLAVAGTAVPCMATEAEANTETVDESLETGTDETPVTVTEDEAIIEEADVETTEDPEQDFVEGSAVLKDYDYKKGEFSADGWKSEFLNMQYVPEEDLSMAEEENEKLEEYYGRNGEDKKVANSELVVKDKNGGYLQMTVEVNPNHESAKDILERFKTNEKLELTSKNKDMTIGGKAFVTVSGVVDKERYLLGVCTEQDDVVLAIKVKYKDSAARETMINGFDVLETTDETAAESESDPDNEELSTPEDFEKNIIIEEDNE